MSLATRCTACGTVFRVVQDQLKVSEGWVRCGRCETVFNALNDLFDLDRDATAPPRGSTARAPAAPRADAAASAPVSVPSQPTAAPAPQAAPQAAPPSSRFAGLRQAGRVGQEDDDADPDGHADFADARFPSELPLDALDDGTVPPARPPAPSAAVAPRKPLLQRMRERRAARRAADRPDTAVPTASELNAASEQPSVTASEFEVLAEASGSGAPLHVQESIDITSLVDGPAGADQPVGPPPGVVPAFLRHAERAERWQRPRVRASLAVAALLLVGLLALQATVQFRNAFAAQWPAMRGAIELLCASFECRIEPLQRLAALTVDASALVQIDGGPGYRLSLGLRNASGLEIAAPAVEVSVTDAGGALIARRAIEASQWRTVPGNQATQPALPPASDTQWQTVLQTDGARISGYTVELFYP